MLDRMQVGDVAHKHHVQLRGPTGELRFEECFTRDGFDGPYTILYHRDRPHTHQPEAIAHGWDPGTPAPARALAKRHYKSQELAKKGGAQIDARIALLGNADTS